jgi:betaine reductase
MSDIRKIVGEALAEIIESAKTGGPKIRVGLMAGGSELGNEELARGGRLAQQQNPNIKVVMIGPKTEGYDELEWIETADCDADIASAMEEALKQGTIQGAVALHYPFPMGVTTIGRVLTPAMGKDMIVASSTGTSAILRTEAMLRNAIYGIAVARAIGKEKPTVGILNIEGAHPVFRGLSQLKENGYDITFGQSVRKDGGAVLRGNDLLSGAVDICVNDTLTGNVMMKLFSSFNTGGSFEALGWGYGPSAGEGWPHVISIISRASGAPVIANALAFNASAVAGDLPGKVAEELKKARAAGLDDVISSLQPKTVESVEEVTAPPAEPTDEEIHGVDVLDVEDAVRELWKAGIYAESAMGCTGPVVKLPSKHMEKGVQILKESNYI